MTTNQHLELRANRRRVRASHILLMTQDPKTNQGGLPQADKDAKHKTMEGPASSAPQGPVEDFAKLAKEFSEDPGFQRQPAGNIPFPRGQMVARVSRKKRPFCG